MSVRCHPCYFAAQILTTGIILCFMSACSFFEDNDSLPYYIDAENPILETRLNEGFHSQNISDVWVTADGLNIGVYPLPASVPVIAEETGIIIHIFAGIRNNGVMSNPVIYPFYNVIEFAITGEPGSEIVADLRFEYKENLKFALIEEFEGNHIFMFDGDEDPTTNLDISVTEVFSGERSGSLVLTSAAPSIEVATDNIFEDLPVDGQPVYLELDYKNDVELLIGLIGLDSGQSPIKFYKLALNPRSEWNKVYVDFTEDLAASQFEAYRILLGAELGNSGLSEAHIFIDNIKLIHF